MATLFRNQKLFCSNCGTQEDVKYPIGVDEMNCKIKVFQDAHDGICKKSWVEPTVDPNFNTHEKAMWWIMNGEVGLSSKTMWACLHGEEKFPIYYPYYPDDFSRCYKLLETIPEWKSELSKVRALSSAWEALIDNWSTLTSMYEENVKNDWYTSKEIGMYDFMQKLLYEKS